MFVVGMEEIAVTSVILANEKKQQRSEWLGESHIHRYVTRNDKEWVENGS